MDRNNLNKLRRMAGVPQDFRAQIKESITEDVVDGINDPILAGGKHRFYLVGPAESNSQLRDVISEVDVQALANIMIGGTQGKGWRERSRQYELFPQNEQKAALDLARKRMHTAGSIQEGAYGHASTANADNVAYPNLNDRGLDIYNQYTFKPAQEEEERLKYDESGNKITWDDEVRRGEAEAGAGMGMPDEDGDVYTSPDDIELDLETAAKYRSDRKKDDMMQGGEDQLSARSDSRSSLEYDTRPGDDEEQNEYEEDEDTLAIDIKDTKKYKDAMAGKTDQSFEPTTNMCPDCEGSGKVGTDGKWGPDCPRCDGEGKMFEAQTKDPKGLSNVVDGLTRTINQLAGKAKEEKRSDMRKMYMGDMQDYKKILQLAKKGDVTDARDHYDNMDTAARDEWYEANQSDEKTTNALARFFGLNTLTEKKANKDYDGDGKIESQEDEHKGVVDKAIKKSKGKTKMKEGKKADKDYDGDGKLETSEEEHKGVVDKAIKKSKKKKVKEAMHYYRDDQYPNSHADDDSDPVNSASDYDTVFDHNADKNAENEEAEDYQMANDETAVKVPPKVLSALKDAIKDVLAQSEKAKPRDHERANYYSDTAEAFNIVLDFLELKTIDGLKNAQIYSQRMMNIQRNLIPDNVWKFIVSGGQPRSLKSYMTPVDKKFPISGGPAPTVSADDLNKNT